MMIMPPPPVLPHHHGLHKPNKSNPRSPESSCGTISDKGIDQKYQTFKESQMEPCHAGIADIIRRNTTVISILFPPDPFCYSTYCYSYQLIRNYEHNNYRI